MLELEITESTLMDDLDMAVGLMRQLRELGVRLSLDDFGTGYSSLGHLKRFPLHRIKIDRTFIRDVLVEPDNACIVSAIISLAHSLRISVVAEGVETTEQMAYLRKLSCEEAQGYLFSKPICAREFTAMLHSNDSGGFVSGELPTPPAPPGSHKYVESLRERFLNATHH